MSPPEGTVVPDVEQELDRLYGLVLNEFTPARNDLARRLRKAGDKQAADAVAALRKPTVTAWAVNQSARRAPDEVSALIEAGQELFEAQKAALAGETAGRFERAQKQQRGALSAVVSAARAILEEAGHGASDQTAARIASTLRAASVDENGQQLLRAGRFTDDFEGAGMFLLAGSAPKRPRRNPSARKASERSTSPRTGRAGELAAARTRLRDAQAAERAARRAAEHAERDADRAEKEAQRAREAAEQANSEAKREAERAATARAQADGAAEAVAQARQLVDELNR